MKLVSGLGLLLVAQVHASMIVYVADGLTRVRPKDPPLSNRAVRIQAARAEYEPFQVVVRAVGDGLKQVTVKAADFTDQQGHVLSRRQFTFYREHYVEVTSPSPKSKEGAGWYPDALIPFANPYPGHTLAKARFGGAPFNVAPASNQPVWVDAFIPKDASPGTYSGSITVEAAGETSVIVPAQVTVWNFTLPDTPAMRSNFGGFGSRLAGAHGIETGSKEFRELERRYAQAMADHRICPPIPSYLYPSVRADGAIDPSRTHLALKEWIEHYRVTGFPISLIGGEPLGRDRARNLNYLRAIFAYLKANHWEQMAYIYVLDEPNDAAAYEQVRARAKLIHQAQPGIKVLCTEQPTPQNPAWGTLVGSVDIWVPLWTLFEENAARERLAAGEELWSYTALCQGRSGQDTPYWELDFPLLDYRILSWLSWRYGLTGLLYWTTVYWARTKDVWTDPATYGEGKYRFNGEGSLFYPGTAAGLDGPVASMRLKQIREGLEDYEYLKALADRGQKSLADGLARRLAKSWTEWETNPGALYSAREEIGRRLSQTAP